MKLKTILGALCAATLLSAGLVALPTGQDDAAGLRAVADFERIKALAGDWEAFDDEGHPVPDADWNFRVTAGGSAVVETLFQGADHEMLTVYHMEDGLLVLTHYCVMGNQPHMHAEVGSPEGSIVFDATHVSNLGAEANPAMKKGRMTFHEDGTLSTLWEAFAGEEPTMSAGFHLRRKVVEER